MAIKLNDKIRIGKYDCEIKRTISGFFIDILGFNPNEYILNQFNLNYKSLKKFKGYNDCCLGEFPYFNSLENLEKVIEFLQSHDKVIILLYL